MRDVIRFSNVYKSYPLYGELNSGFKNFLFNFPHSLYNFRKKRYQVINGISFDIKAGQSVGIVGGNGVGKSTLLGLVANVLKPDSGVVEVSGRVTPLLDLSSGFHPDLTGRENIRVNGVLIGFSRKEIDQKTDKIIEFSEVGDFIDQPLRTYSQGMAARLGFSIAAHLDPTVLLVDETMSVGDVGFRKKCFSKILEFKSKGTTILLVSHEMEDILKLCDRAIWLDKDGVRFDGTPEEVSKEYISHFT